MRYILRLDGTDHAAALTGGAAPRVLIGDTAHDAFLHDQDTRLVLDGVSHRVVLAGDDDARWIWLNGEIFTVAVQEPLAVHARQAAGPLGLETRAPMPGSVVALPVAVGDAVAAQDVLVVIESMKLETTLRAQLPGIVAEIRCAPGSGFDKDALLIRLAPRAEA